MEESNASDVLGRASKLMPNFAYLEAYAGDIAAFLQESEGS